MFVGQQLLAGIDDPRAKLMFWVSENSRGNAELDYLVPTPGGLAPVEVKAGAAGTLRSLHQFLTRSDGRVGFRLHTGLMADEQHDVGLQHGRLRCRIVSVPLYLAELLGRVTERTLEPSPA
jgi:hypothetical protein